MGRLQTLKPKLKTLSTTKAAVSTGSWRTGNQSAASRGYDSKWRKAREQFLQEHPLCECEDCQAGAKRVTAASVVDHRIPHRGDMALFWDRSNWQAMSKPCHDRKTQAETAQDRAAGLMTGGVGRSS